jgi:NADPH-dependent glutamate synthase beta subunit-like oxidoreductase
VGLDRPIAIRALKRFACEVAGAEARPPDGILDSLRAHDPTVGAGPEEMAALLGAFLRGGFEPAAGQKVAIIGGGPAGLAAAHDLALMGFRPTVFEMEPVGAGMLAVGVPGYRLPRALIEKEIDVIRALGVEIRCGVVVGRDVSFARLRSEHAAVVVAVGAKRPRSLGLPGERGPHVYGGVDFLRWVALDEPVDLGRDVVVIGGGNVAYDVARSVLRQIALDTARTAARRPGTERVRLVSLETLEEMPADTVEIREGDEEGIERVNGWGPVEILRDAEGRVSGVVLQRCRRVYDDARRFAPVFDPDEKQTLECDTVLLATGQATDLSFLKEGGGDVRESRPGWPQVDPQTLATTAPGVFVAGDLAHGTRLLIDAVASGKRAARSVYRFVTGRTIAMEALESHVPLRAFRREPGYETLRRTSIPTREPEERLADPHTVVEIGFDEEAARREASRCLDCGVTPVFDGARCVLCGGCVDVCPTLCLKIAGADAVEGPDLAAALREALGPDADLAGHSVILKDEDRCIRCGLCAMRCPSDAISMERLCFSTRWRPA